MAILINEKNLSFHLQGKDYSYIMKVGYERWLTHLYYGRKVKVVDENKYLLSRELGFSPSPLEFFNNRSVSLDTMPQEYPSFGYTDFRMPSIVVLQENGSRITDFRFSSYEIIKNKPIINGMPSIKSIDDDCETLKIVLTDEVTKIDVVLYYNVYVNRNVLTRHVKIINNGEKDVIIEKALSMSLDMADCNYDLIQLEGTHCRERHIERVPLKHGINNISSRRGSSSHQLNPFFAIVSKECNEEIGEVFAANLVYSGNFEATIEVDQRNTTRVQMGINSFDFNWKLRKNEVFDTPEVVMVYSCNGLNNMSNTFHDLYNERLIPQHYHHPIVVNSWEGTYFDFNEEKICNFIKAAKGLGIETFVMDDGWFGKRNDDTTSLGDWYVNKNKLPNGLEGVIKCAKENGMKFGLWFEPEMISIDSDLYRAHPEYAIKVNDREHAVSRCQLVLDLSKEEVCKYIIDSISNLLNNLDISYIKWDFNRNITETYSKELNHRYVLGLYKVLDTLTKKYPNLLIEGCSGGGGRVDPAVLSYTPQIWTSDDSDAIERLFIQYGTSLVYPPTSMVGHVSVCPNHQTGRNTPFNTRGIVAMSANFGYELNPIYLSEQEKGLVKDQIAFYDRFRKVLFNSDFYRLRSPFGGNDCSWSFISKDKKEVYVMYVRILNGATNEFDWLKLKGLEENSVYENEQTKERYYGSELMNIGICLPRHPYDFHGICYIFNKIN